MALVPRSSSISAFPGSLLGAEGDLPSRALGPLADAAEEARDRVRRFPCSGDGAAGPHPDPNQGREEANRPAPSIDLSDEDDEHVTCLLYSSDAADE